MERRLFGLYERFFGFVSAIDCVVPSSRYHCVCIERNKKSLNLSWYDPLVTASGGLKMCCKLCSCKNTSKILRLISMNHVHRPDSHSKPHPSPHPSGNFI